MTTDKTGGPAFPQGTKWIAGNQQTIDHGMQGGMTLRDYFAAKAMQSLNSTILCADVIVSCDEEKLKGLLPHIATVAYAQADAMLRERES